MNYRIYNIEGNIECDTDNLSEKLENIMGLLVEYENKVNAFFIGHILSTFWLY